MFSAHFTSFSVLFLFTLSFTILFFDTVSSHLDNKIHLSNPSANAFIFADFSISEACLSYSPGTDVFCEIYLSLPHSDC